MSGVKPRSPGGRWLLVALWAMLLLPFFLPCHPASASTLPSGWEQQVIEYVTEEMAALKIPGAAVTVVQGSEVVFSRGFGSAGGKDREVTPRTPFLIASLSKGLTGLAVMQLIEAGRLRLDDTLRELIPELVPNDAPAAAVTVADLLAHTSGWSTRLGAEPGVLGDVAPGALARNAERILAAPLDHPRGEYEYSNANYDLLGYLVADISGETYEDYMEAHVFTLLAMTSTFTSEEEAQEAGLAAGHYPYFGVVGRFQQAFVPASVPSGFIYSSAEDLAHLLVAELNEGRYGDARVLSGESMELFHRPLVHPEPSWAYAMGRWVERLPGAGYADGDSPTAGEPLAPLMFDHTGVNASYTSGLLMLPEERLGVVYLLNISDNSQPSVYLQMHIGIANILLGNPPPPTTASEGAINRYGKFLILGLVGLALIRAGTSALWLRRRMKSTPRAALSATAVLRRLALPLVIDLIALGALSWFLAHQSDLPLTSVAAIRWDVPDIFWSWVAIIVIVLGWRLAALIMVARTFVRSETYEPRAGGV